MDRGQVAMDFLAHDRSPGAYDPEIQDRGARLYVRPGHRNLLRQWFALRDLQRRYGRYDVIHSHVDYYGGAVALLAAMTGVSARVVSSHTDSRVEDRSASLARRAYVRLMRALVKRFATAGLGVSSGAAACLFGSEWKADPRWSILPPGIDPQVFRLPPDREAVRAELGIAAETVVFGHVGRLVDAKNHTFLIRVAAELAAREPRAKFLVVGDGPRKHSIGADIMRRGLTDRFVMLPARNDVPRLMLGAMDYFLFPSQYEGLGLALIEAQAAGLTCFASTAVPAEAIAIPALVRRLDLADGPAAWADAILAEMQHAPPVAQPEALEAVAKTFDIRRNAAQLVEFYRAAAAS